METSTTIEGLFGNRKYRFVVPNYQRAYSWEEEQLSQFIEDLNECGKKYYLGHFLFEQEGDTFYVIDGQQRLTTCIIFFSAARKVLGLRKEEWQGEGGAKELELLRDDLAEYYLKDARRNIARFEAVDYDNNFFENAIIEYKEPVLPEELTSKSRIAMHEARKYFEKRLKEASVECIRNWIKKLQEASITTYEVGSKLEAAQIFAYQNDRGKGLTNLEVLKSYLMMQLFKSENSESDIAHLENVFKDIYQGIVNISLHEDTVLNYYWRAKGPQGYYSRNVVSEVKDWLKESQEEQRNKIMEFADGLPVAFALVQKIESNSYDKETAFYVANLRRMNNMAISYPMLIKARLLGVDDNVFCRLVKLMENLTFRSLVRGGRAEIESRLQVFRERNDVESFTKMIDDIKGWLNTNGWWRFWSDEEMIACMWDWFYGNRVDNYLLWRYEQHLYNEEYPALKVSWEDVASNESIEHIAPQNLRTPDNPLADGYGVYNDEKNKSEGIESGGWLNCVGNLALTTKNSHLSNRPFTEKLEIYGENNPLNQEKEIISFVTDPKHPVWDKAAIERRFNKIIEAAKEIWDLEKI